MREFQKCGAKRLILAFVLTSPPPISRQLDPGLASPLRSRPGLLSSECPLRVELRRSAWMTGMGESGHALRGVNGRKWPQAAFPLLSYGPPQ